MEYKEISMVQQLNHAIEENKAALFYFSTPQCSVCKVLKPKIAELISEEYPEISLYYADIEKSPVLSGQYRIFTIPTILIYFDGKEFLRKSRNIGIHELSDEIYRPYNLLFSGK